MIVAPEATSHLLQSIEPFANAVEGLDASFRQLLACDPIQFKSRPRNLPRSVVYLFSDSFRPLYVGRSNNFGQRLSNHCSESSQANQSSFAFRQASVEIQHVRVKYRKGLSGGELLKTIPRLSEEFLRQKRLLQTVDIRYVVEDNQVRQGLLESYTALALKLEHDFGTH